MRGNGRVFRPKVRGHQTAVWWLDYSLHGQRYRESAHTKVKAEAQRLLRQKFAEREAGKVVGRPERVTFAQLRELAERQYVLHGCRSLKRLQQAFAHLERFFRDLDANRLKRAAFQSVAELIEAVMSYVQGHNDDPRPFIWSKTAEQIIEKVGRARRVLDNASTT